MTYREVSERVEAVPFVPFRIEMADGESFTVKNPKLVWIGVNKVMFGYSHPSEPDAHTHHKTLNMDRISRLCGQ